jgi:hypothetical protein
VKGLTALPMNVTPIPTAELTTIHKTHSDAASGLGVGKMKADISQSTQPWHSFLRKHWRRGKHGARTLSWQSMRRRFAPLFRFLLRPPKEVWMRVDM